MRLENPTLYYCNIFENVSILKLNEHKNIEACTFPRGYTDNFQEGSMRKCHSVVIKKLFEHIFK